MTDKEHIEALEDALNDAHAFMIALLVTGHPLHELVKEFQSRHPIYSDAVENGSARSRARVGVA